MLLPEDEGQSRHDRGCCPGVAETSLSLLGLRLRLSQRGPFRVFLRHQRLYPLGQ